jgi:AcrR family transcriptional regulator
MSLLDNIFAVIFGNIMTYALIFATLWYYFGDKMKILLEMFLEYMNSETPEENIPTPQITGNVGPDFVGGDTNENESARSAQLQELENQLQLAMEMLGQAPGPPIAAMREMIAEGRSIQYIITELSRRFNIPSSIPGSSPPSGPIKGISQRRPYN